MKKLFLLLFSVLAFTSQVRADGYVVYQPEDVEHIYWNSDVDNHQPAIKFPCIKAGDEIKIHYTNVSSDCEIKWRGKSGGDWKWETIGTKGSNGILSYTVPSTNQTYADESCTSEEIVTSLKDRGLGLSGTFNLLAVTVIDNNSQLSNTYTLFTGQNYNLGNWTWDNRIILSKIYSFEQVKVGDKMTISYTSDATIDDDVAAINLKESKNTDHTVLASIDNIAQNTTKTFDIDITADILPYLQGGYGYITGKHITITALKITSTNKVLSNNISTESKHFGNWSDNYEPSEAACAMTNEGDILCISYTVPDNETDGCIFLRDKSNGWAQISGYVADNLSGSGTVCFHINSTILALLKAGQIAISGYGAGGSSASDGVQGTGVTITHFTTPAGYRPVYIPASGYATFYGESTCALPDGVKAYYVSSTTDESATLTELSNIPTGQGVILNGAKGIYQLYTTTDEAASVVENKLAGSTSRQQITDASGKYVLYNNNGTPEFRTITKDTYLDAFKCYLNAPGETSKLNIVFAEDENKQGEEQQGETNSIRNIANTNVNNNVVYNMNGQRVGSDYKGLIIVNGKKIIKK